MVVLPFQSERKKRRLAYRLFSCLRIAQREIVQCENCENTGCPDCDGFVVTRDDVILCPECAAACKEDCDKMRAIGCGSCALFADEDDEGQGWCELHQESVCFIDKCSDRISKG